MHLYIGRNFGAIKDLLSQYAEHSRFNYLNATDQIGVNVWIVHVISGKDKKQLLKVLKTSLLRFDSQLYVFHGQKQGKLMFFRSLVHNTFEKIH